MTEPKKTTTTFNAVDGASVEAEEYRLTVPQIRSTVVSGKQHQLVRADGSRASIQLGDFIIRGEGGQVDSMPPALFHQLFEIDPDEPAAQAEAKAAADAEKAQADSDAAAGEADAQAEAKADAADAAEEATTDEPPADDQASPDDETSEDIFADADQPEDPPAEAPKKKIKRSKRKKKA